MAENFTVLNGKKIYLYCHISFVLLVGVMLFDWLPAPALGSFDGPGKWDPSLSAVHPTPCILLGVLCNTACSTQPMRAQLLLQENVGLQPCGSSWAQGQSGRERTQAGKMQAGGQVALWADRSCSWLPCQVWVTAVPLTCLLGRGHCVTSALSATLSVCLQKRWGKAILFHTGLHWVGFFLLKCPPWKYMQLDVAMGCKMFPRWGLQLSIASENSLL